MYYLIDETLVSINEINKLNTTKQFVCVLTYEEWIESNEKFDMGIDIEQPDTSNILVTKAEANYDSITGSFCIPNRENFSEPNSSFAFALDEKGIVFIDDSGTANKIINEIIKTKKWKMPSLERFIFDFLELIVKNDLFIMNKYDQELDSFEYEINHQKMIDNTKFHINKIRSNIRDLKNHYEQLLDFSQVMEENENKFFKEENLRYFKLFYNKIERLKDVASSIQEYTYQIRDSYKNQIDLKQNRIMTILTIVTTIFTPLTLITGWYGMNFKYMPELNSQYSYPILICISILIVMVEFIFFKKWL
jgi:magnesium transporter